MTNAGHIFIPVKLDLRLVSDLFITAFEGGSNYWLHKARLASSSTLPTKSPWYSDQELFTGDYTVELEFDDPDKPEGNGEGRISFSNIDVAKALVRMAAEQPAHFGDLIEDNMDADTADVFLQQLVFHKIVYG